MKINKLKFINFAKLTFYNFLVFFSFLFFIDLVLGNYLKKKNPASEIPLVDISKSRKWDVANLYKNKEQDTKNIIEYIRDENGFRSFEKNFSKKIVLTVGGSTTAQKAITEKKTWQDLLDIILPQYDFVNGGMDGFTSYAHLVSLDNWYPTALNSFDVDTIIYYIGINDIPLLYSSRAYNLDSISTLQSLKKYLSNNSFILRKTYLIFRIIKHQFSDGAFDGFTAGIKRTSDQDFINTPIPIKELNYPKSDNARKYKLLIKELISKTYEKFPNSRIVLIQQQHPGCDFVDKFSVKNRLPYKYSKYDRFDFCIAQGQVYLQQDLAISSTKFVKSPIVIPMYLENILLDDDVYDYVHTNPKGSKKIAEYLKLKLWPKY